MSDFKRVKAVLEHVGIQKKDFAKAIGVSQSHLSNILSEKGLVPNEGMAAIVKTYGVDPNWLLGLIGEDDVVMFNKPSITTDEVNQLRRDAQETQRKLHEKVEEAQRKLYEKVEENATLYKTISELQAEKLTQLKNS